MKDSTQMFLMIAIIFLASIYFTIMAVDYERRYEMLEQRNQVQKYTIDSLQITIDTLEHRLETYDIKHQYNEIKREIKEVIDAIIFVESGDNDNAYCEPEDAVGCLQIRQTMVDDVNRILKRKKSSTRYSYNDRWDRELSIEMFNIYCNYYNLTTAEEMARCWNGGPRGYKKRATQVYWNKVELKLEEAYASR